ncbi:MAG TPA: hypothetical protein VFW92_06695 [Candidatus Limnocylindrales bacterium]|nr:hypothetical protein [Candidatus Limnocylindrales bacterium]
MSRTVRSARPIPSGVLASWRAFGGPRYRPFQGVGLGSAAVFALAGDSLTIPLLLVWGTHPALATFIGLLPTTGSAAQLLVPGLLRRVDGNLRGVTTMFLALGETRGLWLCLCCAATAGGLIPVGLGIAGVAAVMALAGACQAIGATNLQAWYGAVLPEGERRLVAPRVTGISQGLGALLLFPAALLVDAASPSLGTIVYALVFLVGGAASLFELAAVFQLPSPGRVRVAARGSQAPPAPNLERFIGIIRAAAFGSGFGPYLSVYAISVLHEPAGFAIVLSALSALASLVASTFVGGYLARGSSSRMLRISFLLRGGAMLFGLGAVPGTPLAPLVLCLVAVVVAAGAAAGTIAANERLLRLAGLSGLIDAQGRYVAANATGVTVGQSLNATILAVSPVGYVPFAMLFLVSGLVRLGTALRLEVSAAFSSGTGIWGPDELGPEGRA